MVARVHLNRKGLLVSLGGLVVIAAGLWLFFPSLSANLSSLITNKDRGHQLRGFWAMHYTPGRGWHDRTFVKANGYARSLGLSENGQAVVLAGPSFWLRDSDSQSWIALPSPEAISKLNTRWISIDSSGDIVLIGTSVPVDPETEWTAWSSRYVPASGWEPPLLIGADIPRLVVLDRVFLPQGVLRVLWAQTGPKGENLQLLVNQYQPGTGWDPLRRIDDRWPAQEPDGLRGLFVFNGNGEIVNVGTRLVHGVMGPAEMWVRQGHVNGKWSKRQRLREDIELLQSLEAVIDERGRALVVWTEPRDNTIGGGQVFAAHHESGLGWSEPVRIDKDRGEANNARVVMDESGNGLVVWNQFDAAAGWGHRIYAAHYSSTEGWRDPVLLTAPGKHGLHAIAAANSRGEAVVSWEPDIGE